MGWNGQKVIPVDFSLRSGIAVSEKKVVRTLSLVLSQFCRAYSFVVVEPNHPSINSIWDALWWSLVTVSTVGYGDVVPETWMGRLMAVHL